jgi:hypothetical protein
VVDRSKGDDLARGMGPFRPSRRQTLRSTRSRGLKMDRVANLFAEIPADLPEELFQTLLSTPDFRIERIVSHGHASPEGFWYDQEAHE